jgi:hypothetical protein
MDLITKMMILKRKQLIMGLLSIALDVIKLAHLATVHFYLNLPIQQIVKNVIIIMDIIILLMMKELVLV